MPATTIDEAVAELEGLVDTLPGELLAIPEDEAAKKRSDGGWSRKQILGHLMDSAAVNHQRFVRAQVETGISLLYDPDRWVDAQDYQSRPWKEIVELWTALNRHLLHVIRGIPPSQLENICGQGGDSYPWTLSYRIRDYVVHLKHHVEQIRMFPKRTGSRTRSWS